MVGIGFAMVAVMHGQPLPPGPGSAAALEPPGRRPGQRLLLWVSGWAWLPWASRPRSWAGSPGKMGRQPWIVHGLDAHPGHGLGPAGPRPWAGQPGRVSARPTRCCSLAFVFFAYKHPSQGRAGPDPRAPPKPRSPGHGGSTMDHAMLAEIWFWILAVLLVRHPGHPGRPRPGGGGVMCPPREPDESKRRAAMMASPSRACGTPTRPGW